jgi:hypothetical protein
MAVKAVENGAPESVEQAVAGAASLNRLRESAQNRTVVKRTPKKEANREPQLRALRRLLGDVVLTIFPEPLRESIDASYQFWLKNPDSYQITDFDDEKEKDDTLIVMRAYAECAWDVGYTIRTVTDDNPNRLVWRAQNRRAIKDGE